MNILFVEDNQLNRIVAKDVLVKDFENLMFMENGKQVLQYYNDNNVGIIITDLYMPEIDGFELIKVIRSKDTEKGYTYIIVLTSDESDDTMKKVFDLGADDYITKPISFDEISNRIKTGIRLIENIRKN